MSNRSEALKYRNPDFAIHHLITDCPAATVIRELVKNAEENAALLNPPGSIQWFVEMIDGVAKVGIYNEGPGMGDDELPRLMDLASTGKKLGIDNNFGQGGKISALKASPHGVVYRSCKAGRVSQLTLVAEDINGADIPKYSKKWQPIQAPRLNRPLDRDWTEVVLLGQNARHDTVAELLPDFKVKNWLMRLLNARFYRFSSGVTVSVPQAITDSEEDRTAKGLEQLMADHSDRQQLVEAEHPRFGLIQICYCKLNGEYGEDSAAQNRVKKMEASGLAPRGDHVCLVWKNECYDIRVGWSRISGAFGVTFGSSNIAVQIFLPGGAPVKNNTYRDTILDRRGDHQPVTVLDFADVVRRNRPKWLMQYIERQARKNNSQFGVTKRLKAYLDALKAPGQSRFVVEPGGAEEGEAAMRTRRGTGAASDAPYPIDQPPRSTRPATGRRTPFQLSGIPQVSFAEDPAILEEMPDRAGMYRREDNAILLNPRHFKYKEDLDKIFEDAGPGADRRSLAKHLYDEEYCFNAGKFIIQAWLFKGKPHWEDRAWLEGVSMNALTVHLASPLSLDDARRRLRQKLNSRKLEMQNENSP